MAIITVSGIQIELTVNQIKFTDIESGLTRIIRPKAVTLNLDDNSVTFNLHSILVTSTGYEIGQPIFSNYQINIKADTILGDGFQKPFANAIFQEALWPYGIRAKQIFDSTGKLNIIE